MAKWYGAILILVSLHSGSDLDFTVESRTEESLRHRVGALRIRARVRIRRWQHFRERCRDRQQQRTTIYGYHSV